MRNSTIIKYNRWKRDTKVLREALTEEMADALSANDTNALRAHMINCTILDHTMSVVKDWMERKDDEDAGNV